MPTFSAGQVNAALWENEIDVKGRTVTVLKATVQRRYKDNKTDTWKSSGSFNRNEIPLAIYCLQKCFEKIIETQSEQSSDNNDVEEMVVSD